jgi:hypothetical protein
MRNPHNPAIPFPAVLIIQHHPMPASNPIEIPRIHGLINAWPFGFNDGHCPRDCRMIRRQKWRYNIRRLAIPKAC